MIVVVGLTLEYGVRAILYNADLPRDLGMIKPFSETPTGEGDFGTIDMMGDLEGKDILVGKVESSLNAGLRKLSVDGDTFEGLLPI